MKVKIIDEAHELDLQKAVNKFLDECEDEVVDIKYNVAMGVCGEEQLYCFSALIMYQRK